MNRHLSSIKTLRPADCCAHCVFSAGTTSLMVVRCEMHRIARAATDYCSEYVLKEEEAEDDE